MAKLADNFSSMDLLEIRFFETLDTLSTPATFHAQGTLNSFYGFLQTETYLLP